MTGRARSRGLATVLRLALGVALVTGSVSLVVAAPAEAYPGTCRETFLAPTPVQAPPHTTGAALVTVPVSGQVADVDVTLTAQEVQSETFFLRPGDHSRPAVLLASIGGGVDLQAATWDDEAVGLPGELAGTSPYSGRYRPFDSLATLDGLSTDRSWELTVENTGNATMYVDQWSITLTYAGCAPDRDGDAVPDRTDACGSINATTASGCPAATQAMSLRYRRGAFKGVLSSSAPACRAGKPVVVWKVRRGPDRRIGTATTRANGSYRLARPRRAGRYYVTTRAIVVRDVAQCPGARSARLRLR